ncbi:MAG: undecaprenyldiphospho-muramoylpentapeptide beta-N-acetylglucosaminyltransferase [Bacteroidaceae bacterium]|nr:undecaprenyldiphospho-muramoylpentapeptide beta-N-acetylglucosaminyltransferase [Bacteroidaceae bacterium]
METKKPLKVIVSGGGTGGHIFPAISIANAIRQQEPDAEILFVGALGRMEMQRVPDAGYRIIGLPVSGFDRKNKLKNIPVLLKLVKSLWKARRIVKDFRPDVAVGVGGYASGPTLKMAAALGVPTVLQEQNSYAGVTNKKLAQSACKICVAYDGMERFFPAEKIIKTGNPVRQNLLDSTITKADAVRSFGLDPQRRTVLIIGGSLGARTINESVLGHLDEIRQNQHAQFIWQTGKIYHQEIMNALAKAEPVKNLHVTDFISSMDAAYAAADLVISRAGASSISELCLLSKPCILVPSPNVAEDHQTKNAQALATRGAAVMVPDCEARETLISLAIQTVTNPAQLISLGEHAGKMAYHHSAEIIAEEVIKLARKGNTPPSA